MKPVPEEILARVRQVIENSEEHSTREKRRMLRRLRRRRPRRVVLDYVTAEGFEAGVLGLEDIDWDELLAFLEKLFELIVKLINAFPDD